MLARLHLRHPVCSTLFICVERWYVRTSREITISFITAFMCLLKRLVSSALVHQIRMLLLSASVHDFDRVLLYHLADEVILNVHPCVWSYGWSFANREYKQYGSSVQTLLQFVQELTLCGIFISLRRWKKTSLQGSPACTVPAYTLPCL